MFGNGLSGVATNLLKVVFSLIWPDTDVATEYRVGVIYFITCAIYMLASAFLFDVLMKNEYYIYQKKQSLKDKPIDLPEGAELP